jgi:hypothetical protein
MDLSVIVGNGEPEFRRFWSRFQPAHGRPIRLAGSLAMVLGRIRPEECVTKVFTGGKKIATDQAFADAAREHLRVFLSINRG